MKYHEVCGKQIIHIETGRVLGAVCDISFDPCTFELIAIYACKPKSKIKRWLSWLFPCEVIEIHLNEIVYLQGDVILVNPH